VNALNVAIRDFPGNIIASLFGFEKKERFEAVEGAQKAPKVDLEVK
jgi:LemA protein